MFLVLDIDVLKEYQATTWAFAFAARVAKEAKVGDEPLSFG